MRVAGYALLAFLMLFVAPPTGFAGDLHIAAWNLEHLDDTEGEGCVGRNSTDYAALARQIEELGADIVAFQEVENEAAARRVFPASNWNIEIWRRPPMERGRACWGKPEARLGHLATGFAIRKGIRYRRNADLKTPGGEDAFQRWGVDIAVVAGSEELGLLSVHLKTGCWGETQDRDNGSRKACMTLRDQMRGLKAWVDARRAEEAAFVILGNFNRRLALPGDWARRLLSPPSAPLLLLTEGVPFRCDPRFPAFIDHIVAGGGAAAVRRRCAWKAHSGNGPAEARIRTIAPYRPSSG